MRGLLEKQPTETLSLFLEKKSVSPTDDLIADVLGYYSYLDVLLMPTPESVLLCDNIFTNDEILSCIVEWLPECTRYRLAQINKRFNDIIRNSGAHWGESYLAAVRRMDWWSISTISTFKQEQCMYEAARCGYELCLESMVSYRELALHTVEGSDLSDRYFDLFRRFYHLSYHETDYRTDQLYLGCAESNDARIFEYLQKNHGHFECGYTICLHAAYYGSVDILSLLSIYDNSFDEDWCTNVSEILTVAYVGGNYDKVLAFSEDITTEIPTSECLYEFIMLNENPDYELKNLDLLTDLVKRCSVNATVVFEFAISGLEYTLEEFKRLWDIIGKDVEMDSIRLENYSWSGYEEILEFLSDKLM